MSAADRDRIDCEEALRRLAEYLDRELEAASEAEVAAHLETCRSCYSRLQFEKGLKARLGELRQEPVGRAFESRICDLARDFTLS